MTQFLREAWKAATLGWVGSLMALYLLAQFAGIEPDWTWAILASPLLIIGPLLILRFADRVGGYE